MPILAAVAKHLFRAFIADPKGVLKFLLILFIIPLLVLSLLLVAPLSLFTHVPLVQGEEYHIYQKIIKDIKTETGIEIDINYLIGIDAVLLEQDFSKASESKIEKIAWAFIDSKEEKRTRTVEEPCEKIDPKTKKPYMSTCEKEKEYTVIVYSLKDFDTVLTSLVSNGTIKNEWIEDIKRYTDGSAADETKVDMDNLPVVTDGTFMRPATGRITSGFGMRWGRRHTGVDIGAGGRTGVPIVASAAGTVVKSYRSNEYGECIIIRHNLNGQQYETLYAHMVTGSRKFVVGESVDKGQVIGIMGSTGNSTGPHLHFEIHIGQWASGRPNAIDPVKFVQF